MAIDTAALNNDERQRLIEAITNVVADEAGRYAYWSSYGRCWRVRRGPNLAGIVAATMRALERRK